MEYLDGKIEFCQKNPDIGLAEEIKEVAEIDIFLNKNKAILSKDIL